MSASRQVLQPPTGHVFRVDRARGPVWYAKYRLTNGRQVQRKIGPAWTGRGRPPTGYVTKRLAEDWLRNVLDQARRGTLPGMVVTGATFADAAAEYLRYVEHDRERKPNPDPTLTWQPGRLAPTCQDGWPAPFTTVPAQAQAVAGWRYTWAVVRSRTVRRAM